MSGKYSKPETAFSEGWGGAAYDELVQAIYESALNPESWQKTLDQLRIHLDASAFNLIGFKLTDYANPFLLSYNIPSDYGQNYQAYWGERDIWVQAARDKNLAEGGHTLAGSMLVERRELVRSAFYNDWLVGQDIGDVLCSNLWDAKSDMPHVVLCYFRGVGSEGFDESDRRKLQSVSRHLNRAFRIAFRLGLLERGRDLNEAVVAWLSQAVFLLDAGCRILQGNPAAERLLNAMPTAVRIRHGRVIGLGTRACPAFDEALNLADQGRHTRIAFTLAKPGEAGETLSALVAPLSEVFVPGLPSLRARYLVVIDNCRGINKDSLRSFCGLFHLTAAEQSVLLGLMEEATPEAIAAGLRVSVATVRSHIQHIRQKTGVRRLTELVRMALAASRAS
ncbi:MULTISPECIES: helix-turn-helix transcriptional regulator [Methylococcus]|uniref:helix-turn-helix transcriptional regulator n=1 Tax=Methylococcus TaxID=413 RepID=UPI001C52722E|nr:helix-turn-helix transcriptional regulator [Methylococcus capsulatus]QXP91910.1 helix-turn-helix transcriptional regulator [Methylococcus capsulatus]